MDKCKKRLAVLFQEDAKIFWGEAQCGYLRESMQVEMHKRQIIYAQLHSAALYRVARELMGFG